jgi:hypothetical protein
MKIKITSAKISHIISWISLIIIEINPADNYLIKNNSPETKIDSLLNKLPPTNNNNQETHTNNNSNHNNKHFNHNKMTHKKKNNNFNIFKN